MKFEIDFKRLAKNLGLQGINFFETIIGCFLALFWAWLVFSFIRFMLFYSFGLIEALGGNYGLALEAIKANRNIWSILSFAIVFFYFIWNVPIVKGKFQKEPTKINRKVRGSLGEKLAELEHRQWIHWSEYMLNHLTEENIKRWKKQIKTPYLELTEKEKSSDREWAKKVLEILDKGFIKKLKGISKKRFPDVFYLFEEDIDELVGDKPK